MTTAPDPGLCGSCRHARVVVSRRGSRFHLCERSRRDPRYPRYPRLPVLACAGWEEAVDGSGEGVEGGEEVRGAPGERVDGGPTGTRRGPGAGEGPGPADPEG